MDDNNARKSAFPVWSERFIGVPTYMFFSEQESFGRQESGNLTLSPTPANASDQYQYPFGLRNYLEQREGEGFWDLLAIRPGFFLTMTEVAYKEPKEIILPDEQIIKIRTVLSGQLLDGAGNVFAEENDFQVHSFSGKQSSKYIIPITNEPFRLLVAHIHPRAIKEINLDTELLSPPFDAAAQGKRIPDLLLSIPKGLKMFQICKDIYESRNHFHLDTRTHYLALKAEELLCLAIERTRPRVKLMTGAHKIRDRDIFRLQEIKAMLVQNPLKPPSIAELARMSGLNQNKLTLGFRKLFGSTIQEFVIQARMQIALDLVENSDHPFSEIAYRSGYQHPANFTNAFKRFYGATPSKVRRRAHTDPRRIVK